MTRFPSLTTRRPGRLKPILLVPLLLLIGVALYPAVRYAWVSVHYNRARSAIERRDFASARAHLAICVREWPESGETRFLAARTARRAGDLDEAQRLLKEAKRLNWVSEAIDLEDALLTVHKGDYRTVVGYLMSCVRHEHPDSLLILETLVPAMYRAFDLHLANEGLEQWVRLAPNDPQPHIYKGEICERLRQKEEALQNYREAVRVGPDNFEARLHYARLLSERKLPDEAQTHYEWLLQRQPEHPEVRIGLARCRHELGHDDEARKLLDGVQAERPDAPEALTLRGLIDLDSGRPAEAEKWFRKALEKEPSAVHLLHNLARCLDQLGQAAEAEHVRKKTQEIAQDLDQAAVLLRQIASAPREPGPRRDVALILLRNGQDPEAKRWLDSAVQLDPKHVPSLEALADYYERLGDLPRAKEYRQLAQEYKQRK